MSEKAPFMVFSGTNSRYLAEKICASLDCPLGKMNITHFADGEFAVSYEESIRGANVFLVQSTFPNSDNLMELLLMVDAAKRASAKECDCSYPLLWLGTSRPKRQTTCIYRRQAGGRLTFGCRYRPFDYYGSCMPIKFRVFSIFLLIICTHRLYSFHILNH